MLVFSTYQDGDGQYTLPSVPGIGSSVDTIVESEEKNDSSSTSGGIFTTSTSEGTTSVH